MTRRTESVKAALRSRIERREFGFIDTLPSIRDLTDLLKESYHVVHQALKELEREQLITALPRKGFQVHPAALNTAAGAGGSPEQVEVVFAETCWWQTGYWCEMLRRFEALHPKFRVRPRFLAADPADQLLLHLHARRGNPVVLVQPPFEFVRRWRAFMPLPEIERVLGHPLFPRSELLPELRDNLTTSLVPYILQPQYLFVRCSRGQVPDTSSWERFYQSLRSLAGPHSLLPPGTMLLLEKLGLAAPPPDSELEPRTTRLYRLIHYAAEQQLYEFGAPGVDDFDLIRKILNGSVSAFIRNSFYLGALGPELRRHRIEILPIPPGGQEGVPACCVSMLEGECTPGAAAFFQFVLSEENQCGLMRAGLGISPFRHYRRKVHTAPEEYPPRLDAVIRRLENAPPGSLLFSTPSEHEPPRRLAALLTDRLILPLLGGHDVSLPPLLEAMRGCYAEDRNRQQLDFRREQLLRG